MVSCDAKHWGAMEKSKEEQSPIALRNCSIQRSKRTLDLEVIANNDTEVAASPKKYKMDKSIFLSSKPSVKLYSLIEACKLAPGAVISVMAKVTVVKPPEKILKKDRRCLLRSKTASSATRLELAELSYGLIKLVR